MARISELRSLSDDELVRTYKEDPDPQVFDVIDERYRDAVMDKCMSMVKNSEVAKDLAQDIIIKIMEKLPTFKGKSSLSTWIYSISYNHCIDYLRRTKRIKFDDWADDLDIPDEVRDTELDEIFELAEERVTLLLELLKPDEKAILLLKYREEMPLKKIMYILSIEGESRAKMRISRAKKHLVALYNQFFSTT